MVVVDILYVLVIIRYSVRYVSNVKYNDNRVEVIIIMQKTGNSYTKDDSSDSEIDVGDIFIHDLVKEGYIYLLILSLSSI